MSRFDEDLQSFMGMLADFSEMDSARERERREVSRESAGNDNPSEGGTEEMEIKSVGQALDEMEKEVNKRKDETWHHAELHLYNALLGKIEIIRAAVRSGIIDDKQTERLAKLEKENKDMKNKMSRLEREYKQKRDQLEAEYQEKNKDVLERLEKYESTHTVVGNKRKVVKVD